MMRGTVARLHEERGFGFIVPDGESAHDGVFFHCRQLAPELVFDQQLIERRVEFEIEKTDKGRRALHVRPL